MIRSNLQLAFSVEVSHSYFAKNICSCLQFEPGNITSDLMKRFDLKIRENINGFDLFVNTRNAIPAYLQYIGKAFGQYLFNFEIKLNDPNFYLYTELPINWMGQLIYDTHNTSNSYGEGGLKLGQKLSENSDLTGFGSLKVYFDDIIKLANNEGPVKLRISYSARSTQRQYFVINKSLMQLNNPAIAGKAGIEFNVPENVVIENGQQALLFSSGNNLIPLSENPTYKFDLVNRPAYNGNGPPAKGVPAKIIIKGLPDADPGRIKILEVEGKKQVSSPIYVYV